MGFLKKLEEHFLTGRVLKDYGVVHKHQPFAWWRTEYRVLLTEKKQGRRIIIKQNSGMKREMNLNYFEFDLAGAKRLKEALEDILRSF